MSGRRLAYRPALDGVRAIAVAGVLAFHGGVAALPGGFLGVSTFFTLSGFLITSLLLREYAIDRTIVFSRFWVRRFRRLMPAALLALAGIGVFGLFVADPTQLVRLRGDALFALGYLANWHFILEGRDYAALFAQPSPVQHFWSLSIEEQYYAVYPLLLFALLRIGGSRRGVVAGALVGLTGVSIALTCGLAPTDPARAYYGTDTRAAELLIGGWLALALPMDRRLGPGGSRGLNALGVLCLLGLLALWSLVDEEGAWLERGGLVVNAGLSAGLIAAAVRPGIAASLLGTRPLVALGRISYGVYLYHWPIFLWLDPARTGLDGAALLGLRVGLTIGVAALSYAFVEAPIRAGRRLVGVRMAIGSVLAAVGVTALIVGVTWRASAPELSSGGERAEPRSFGEPASRRDALRIAVLGDSVAHNLVGGLRHRGEQQGTSVIVGDLTQSNCGLVRGGNRRGLVGRMANPCPDQAPILPARLAEFDPDIVVAMSGFWDLVDQQDTAGALHAPGEREYDERMLADLEVITRIGLEAGVPVVWLTYPCADPVRMRKLPEWSGGENERIIHQNRHILPRLDAIDPAVTLIDLYGFVCPDGRYTSSLDDVELARGDGLHFTPGGARHVADWLVPQLRARVDAQIDE